MAGRDHGTGISTPLGLHGFHQDLIPPLGLRITGRHLGSNGQRQKQLRSEALTEVKE